jgi:hypothetical protein
MCISKAEHPIRTLDDWFLYAPPKSPGQWQPTFSAMELARAWLAAPCPELPPEVAMVLATSDAFGPVLAWTAEPEVRERFDNRAGEPRNTDLVVRATDRPARARTEERFVISVEGKADESFAQDLKAAARDAGTRRAANPRSRGTERINDLCLALFGMTLEQDPKLGTLRHQLLYATAAALAAARRCDASRAVLLIHEFRSARTKGSKLAANAQALDAFVARLTKGATTTVEAGRLYAVERIPGSPLFVPDGESFTLPRLFVGKAIRTLE